MSVLEQVDKAVRACLGARPAVAQGRVSRHLRLGLERLCAQLGLSPEQIAARLPSEPALCLSLAEGVTVDESFFFRQPEDFDALVAGVRERLADPARGRAPITVWSAGCASGEEPYSIAIAIHRALGAAALSQVQVLATDASLGALAEARAATYGAWSLRGVSEDVRARYFEPADPGRFRVVDAVRHAVRFEHEELRARAARFERASLDAVFFRNVAIYLTPEAALTIHGELARVLRSRAVLAFGAADPRPAPQLLPDARFRPGPALAVATPAGSRDLAASPKLAKPLLARRSPPRSPRRSLRPRATAAATATGPRALQQVVGLADRGRMAEAFALLEQLLTRQGTSADLLALRGQLHMAEGHAKQAVADLRSALYLSDDPLVRFHYAAGLKLLHESRRSQVQLSEVLRALSRLADDDALSDGQTTVASLRRATDELLRRIT